MESATDARADVPVGPAAPSPSTGADRHAITLARIVRFGSVATVVLAVCSWFVGATWTHFSGESDLAGRIALIVAVLAFVPVTIMGRFWQHPLLKPLTLVSAVAVGALNYALVAAIVTWVAVGLSHLFGFAVASRSIVFACYGAAAVVIIYALANAATLRVTRVTIALPNLPPAWRGRTAALVTDLHFGHVLGAGFARRVVARLATLAPDAVFIAGDLFDGAAIDRAAAVAPWRQLAPPRGIYFVTGNHDEFAHRFPVLAAVRGAGIHVLDNAKVELDGLQLIGVHDAEASDPRLLREILARAQVDRARPSLLLNHQPANLAIPETAGISLQLSGHTHSGQFWPWNLIVKRIYGPFGYGLHRFQNLQVLTSSGAGTWGPPLRLATRSEVVLLTFA